jgi:hypothetical protein
MNFLDLFRRQRSRPETKFSEESEAYLRTWRIYEISNDVLNQRVVVRLKMTRPELAELKPLHHAVVITWPYESDDSMPPPDVNQAQLQFERSLDPLTCDNGNSESVRVTTGAKVKEWLFYAESTELFMKGMNDLLRGQPAFPVKIEFFNDPDWKIWQETNYLRDAKASMT